MVNEENTSETYSDKFSSEDVETPFLEHDEEQDGNKARSSRLTALILFQASAALFILSILILIAAIKRVPTDQECVSHIRSYSPMFEAVEFEEVDFANKFAQKSLYRGPPTPELEAAWDALWITGGTAIPASEFPSLNRSKEMSFQRVDDNDENSPFVAMIEGFHQLHCLNLVRQYTWLDHYETKPIGLNDGAVAARMHADHCIETLRLSLMCNFDTTPFLVEEDENSPLGHRADFNSHHKCLKFEPLKAWMKTNEVVP